MRCLLGGQIIESSLSRRRQASLLGWEYTTQDTQHYLKRKSTHTFGMNNTTVGLFLLGMFAFARKKTYVKSSGKAGNQDKLRKKKADQSSGMETYYSGSTHTTEESIHKSFGTNYVLQLLDNALYQTGSSLHQIPPQVYYAGSTVLPEERSKSLCV